MPRNNRVTPYGQLIAVPDRGMFLGFRGVLHDDQGNVVRFAAGKAWAICALEFKGRRRPLWAPGRLTELFFLDEATGLAAGHRPCGECRYHAYASFKRAWAATHPDQRASAPAIDAGLHADRLSGPGVRRTFTAEAGDLPDGAMAELDGRYWLVRGGTLLAWSPGGYGERRPARGRVTVITPRSTVAVLAAGYQPALHSSAAIYLDTDGLRNILLFVTEAPVQRRTVGGTFRTGGAVTDIDQITPRMRQIRVEGPDVARLTSVPGQQVRVFVSELREPRNWLRPKDFLRTYSIWRHDEGLELCALDHGGDGPGERWTRALSVGDTVSFTRPEGSFTLSGEDTYHVFAGEETAAVAFGAMLRVLPADVPAYGVIEVDEPEDQLPLDRELSWLYRHGRPAASSETLVNALAELPLPSSPGIAYLAGEARTIQMLRRHLVSERGWPRQSVHTKPFWTPGKRGLD